jgi:hypothetical protein
MDEAGVVDEKEVHNAIYILDDSFVNNQIDLIDHFDALSNCVILKSTHENIVNTRVAGSNMSSLMKWNTLQEIIENKDYRGFYYFHNENHENTYFSESEVKKHLYGKSKEFKNRLKCLRVFIFYILHLEHALDSDKKIVLLTDSQGHNEGETTLENKEQLKFNANFRAYEYLELMSDQEGHTNYARLFVGDDAVYERIKKYLFNIMTTDEYILTQSDDHPEGNFLFLTL